MSALRRCSCSWHGPMPATFGCGPRYSVPRRTPPHRMLQQFSDRARKTALNDRAAEAERRRSTQILSYYPFPQTETIFKTLLEPAQPPALQAATVRALSVYAEPAVAPLLLSRW